MAAVGQLVSGVAHELNNPLTSIAGLSEFLLEQKELGTKDRGHLRVIHEQAERAGRIVGNLLTFARKGPAEQAPVDLNDVIQRTLALMSYDLKLKDIAIENNLAAGLPAVLGDRHALHQVMLNLLTNAAHAAAAHRPARTPAIEVATWADDRVHVRVADSGGGIPDDVVPHLFTPFFTTKEPGAGTGLGLSITYSIVESHGGHIALERPSGRGAVFLVDLPLAGEAHGGGPYGGSHARSPAVSARSLPWTTIRRTAWSKRCSGGRPLVEGARDRARGARRAPGQGTGDRRSAVPGRDDRQARPDVPGQARGEDVQPLEALSSRTLVATGDIRAGTEETLARLGLRYVRKPFNLRDLLDEAARVWAAERLS